MKTLLKTTALASLLLGSSAVLAAEGNGGTTTAATTTSPVAGRWDAVLSRGGVDIPFRLDIKGQGNALQGVFYDGFQPYDGTTSATFENGKLTLNVEHYLTTISADLKDGTLTGTAIAQNRESTAPYTFRAVRHVEAPAPAVNAPSIAGTWIIPLAEPSSKGEKAFRFVAQQRGGEVAGAILRIDGDTGSYTGNFKDGKWTLSHFDGGRPGVIVVTPTAQGTLEIQQQVSRPAKATASEYGNDATPDGRYAPTLTAYRKDVAKAKGLPEPDDFLTHTTVNDPNEVFKFSFPDANGKLVSNEDPDFKGKVIVAVVTGTWCPNCHDEAQYLVKLDKKYRAQGLRIVALNFEEPEQQETLKRQKAFIKQYGVEYPYLLAGSPAQMWEKVPQLNHLDTWPATVFIGRDGKVKAVHSGFASPASGEFHTQLEADFTSRIEKLLAEKPVVAATAPSVQIAQK
ncbi:peroxiredoxin family protein [Sphingomonas immobilis]|uniref:TlpA disulfide reductase family protein n=1 Tax=Sphingomonas immobilis TaxID=3063997 RepID=A0ABT9A0Y9_9SPHN|nr:TlpA disulfide reductase family protein [Sphingomonas sp. CA1-15]MDO7843198.1 TlpA disulfide reductase family protein [Sphingomonas sp. CA1-15]